MPILCVHDLYASHLRRIAVLVRSFCPLPYLAAESLAAALGSTGDECPQSQPRRSTRAFTSLELSQAHLLSITTCPVFLLFSPDNKRATSSVTLSVANFELVAKQNSGRNPHVVVVGGSIGVQREPVKLGRTQRDMLRRPDVQSAAEHHGKSAGRAR